MAARAAAVAVVVAAAVAVAACGGCRDDVYDYSGDSDWGWRMVKIVKS